MLGFMSFVLLFALFAALNSLLDAVNFVVPASPLTWRPAGPLLSHDVSPLSAPLASYTTSHFVSVCSLALAVAARSVYLRRRRQTLAYGQASKGVLCVRNERSSFC